MVLTLSHKELLKADKDYEKSRQCRESDLCTG